MLPETLTVPVEIVTRQSSLLVDVLDIVIEAQERVPVATASILVAAEVLLIVTAPVTVKLLPVLIVTVLFVAPEFMVKLLQTAAVLTEILKVIPFGITTSCALVGTKFNDQFPAVFQFALDDPSQVFVCPKSWDNEPTVNRRIIEITGTNCKNLVFISKFLFVFYYFNSRNNSARYEWISII
jgi:hypothetical protein